ncbi:MAG TPA: hypothetical protein ENI23_06480 [bacterium]|nr:hypothetical protein [bacterium]
MIKQFIKCLTSYKTHSPTYIYINNKKFKRGIVATSTAIIAGAVIAGGAAVAGGAIAASGAKKAAEKQAQSKREAIEAQERAAAAEAAERGEAVARKETALEKAVARKEAALKIPFTTISETPEGQRIRGTLESRIAGQDVGFRPEAISAATGAFAKQRRAGLSQFEIPAITSAASARGVGRSTITSGQIGRATQTAEQDIESRVAQLGLASEQQRSFDIQKAMGGFQRFAETETAGQQRRSIFQRGGEFDVAQTELGGQFGIASTLEGNATIERENQFAIANSIAQQGADAAAFELKQAAILGSALVSAGAAFSLKEDKATDDLIAAITKDEDRRNAALVARPVIRTT